MPVLGIKVDVDGPLKACKDLRENQIPFTIARALTLTANDARDAARVKEGEVFTLRNDWTQQRTLTKMATKTDMTAQVYTDTENRKTGAPDYMPLQDDGGTKRPRGYVNWAGEDYLAVPTKYLRRICPGVVPLRYKPTTLLELAKTGPLSRAGMRRRKQQIRSGVYYFVQRAQSGVLMIMTRDASDDRDTARPLYVLVTSAHVRGRHPIDEVVQQVVEANFTQNFSKAATETIANDLLRGSGVSVKL